MDPSKATPLDDRVVKETFIASKVKHEVQVSTFVVIINVNCLLLLPTGFQQWKDEFERNSGASFVKATGEKGQGSVTTNVYYYCNRSDFFHTKATGRRHIKSQGSSKLNAHCTAAITVRKNIPGTNIVKVNICKTHYGHNCSLGYTRLSETDRLTIAGQLAQGITFERIFDNIRDNVGIKQV